MEKKIISLGELEPEEVRRIIRLAVDLKRRPSRYRSSLEGRRLLLLFQKTSTRTRAAFELGMKGLGGQTVVMEWEKSNLAISPISYEAAFLSRVFDCVMARLVRNEDMVELARSLAVPAVNGCCDRYHPSQILADLMTIYEIRGDLRTSLCYVGVQNNVANSLLLACRKLGIRLTFVTPLKDSIPREVQCCMAEPAADEEGRPLFEETMDLEQAVGRCEFLYTDTWVNMERFHDRSYRQERVSAMLPYQINRRLVENRDLYIMHDMPVHPGYEIDDYSITCGRSVIFQQAENRLYTAQALLLALLDGAQEG